MLTREIQVDKKLKAESYLQFALFQMIQRGAVVVSLDSDDLGFVKSEVQEAFEVGAVDEDLNINLVMGMSSLYIVSDKLESIAMLLEAASFSSDALATLDGKVWVNYGSFDSISFGQEMTDVDDADEFVSEIWECKRITESDLIVD